ncbi:SDR family NAD(P)-dependent oxidoreductase [Halothiobacillus sp. DCM-1]|uniref:SDR family NAD(P)-dependent oxidoreductase n=1 Tax=Halothiobacillus sp. DCM-1 TaxID=3112558 RepID=UPI003245F712
MSAIKAESFSPAACAASRPVTWVVGANSGIGLALVDELLGRAEQAVVASSRRLNALDARVQQYPDRCQAIAVDVTQPATLVAAMAQILARWGRLDRVVLNAADYTPMGLADFDPALFERLMTVNFIGVVHGIDAVREHFIAQRQGEILITASVAGFRGLPYAAPYGATKAALISLAESLAPEFARHGVRLRVINPGFVRTPMTDKNAFEMPGIIEPSVAAAAIVRAFGRRRFEILVPWGFGWVMKRLRCLPYPLFFALTRRMLK